MILHGGLTEREFQTLLAVCHGRSNAEAADRLCVQPQTVKNHLTNVYRKLAQSGAVPPNRPRCKTSACVWLYRTIANAGGKW